MNPQEQWIACQHSMGGPAWRSLLAQRWANGATADCKPFWDSDMQAAIDARHGWGLEEHS